MRIAKKKSQNLISKSCRGRIIDSFKQLNAAFSPIVSDWKPTGIQQISMKSIIHGDDALLIAPTGSGKTEAALLPLLQRRMDHNWAPCSIIHITPLRSLNRDLGFRLDKMAKVLDISTSVRHGDTSPYQRQRQTKNPPDLLVTTPETLQALFLGPKVRAMISKVQAVILDEVHEIASSERGSQLSVALSRLEDLAGHSLQRIGLSATVGNPKELANWVANGAKVWIDPKPRPIQISTRWIEASEMAEVSSHELRTSKEATAALFALSEHISNHGPSLVFCTSRSEAETVGQRLDKISLNHTVDVHHGSLAYETREDAENRLRNGEIDALICTSSLELGLDVGTIGSVVQLRSPKTASRLVQRIGRSNHCVNGTAIGSIYCWDFDDLLESSVISRRAMCGDLDPVSPRPNPTLVILNQCLLVSRSEGAVPLPRMVSLLRSSGQFEYLDRGYLIEILKQMQERWLVDVFPDPMAADRSNWPWISKDLNQSDEQLMENSAIPPRWKNGWFKATGRGWRTAIHSLSMIHNERRVRVRDVVSRRILGVVDESFVLSLPDESDPDSRAFVMAGRVWSVIDADLEEGELVVSPGTSFADAPVWSGEVPLVPAEVAFEIGAIRRAAGIEIGIQDESNLNSQLAMRYWKDLPIDASARGVILSRIAEHADLTGGIIPDDRTITIERRKSGLSILCCAGNGANETLGLALQAMASTREGRMGSMSSDAVRINLDVPGCSTSDVEGWLNTIPPSALRPILETVLPNSRAMRHRFVQVARGFGHLRTVKDPRRIEIGGMMRAMRGTPLWKESMNKVIHERLDLITAEQILLDIQSGKIRVFKTPAGPLGFSTKNRKGLRLPEFTNDEVISQLRSRLENERAVMICMNCERVRSQRVAKIEGGPLSCNGCKGKMLVSVRENLCDMLKKWLNDPEHSDRMTRNAELVKRHGRIAILTMMGRGIGETTAQRVLRSIEGSDERSLLEAIHRAELEYARTRRYWS